MFRFLLACSLFFTLTCFVRGEDTVDRPANSKKCAELRDALSKTAAKERGYRDESTRRQFVHFKNQMAETLNDIEHPSSSSVTEYDAFRLKRIESELKAWDTLAQSGLGAAKTVPVAVADIPVLPPPERPEVSNPATAATRAPSTDEAADRLMKFVEANAALAAQPLPKGNLSLAEAVRLGIAPPGNLLNDAPLGSYPDYPFGGYPFGGIGFGAYPSVWYEPADVSAWNFFYAPAFQLYAQDPKTFKERLGKVTAQIKAQYPNGIGKTLQQQQIEIIKRLKEQYPSTNDRPATAPVSQQK